MPSLQLDAPHSYDVDTKRLLARRLGSVYAAVMQTRPELVTIAIRDLGPGGVWRCTDAEPHEAALLMCDVRSGRPVDTRAALAGALIDACSEIAGLDPRSIKVEFTQHPGDDMYHPHLGGFNHDWVGDESGS